MRQSFVERELTRLGEVYRSEHLRKFVERCGKVQSQMRVDPEFVVALPQVVNEDMPSDHDVGSPVPWETRHWSEPGVAAPLVGFDAVVGVVGGVVQCLRQEL